MKKTIVKKSLVKKIITCEERSHTLTEFFFTYFLGIFRGGIEILARVKMVLGKHGLSLQIKVRSVDSEVTEFVTSTFS